MRVRKGDSSDEAFFAPNSGLASGCEWRRGSAVIAVVPMGAADKRDVKKSDVSNPGIRDSAAEVTPCHHGCDYNPRFSPDTSAGKGD